MGFRRIEAAVDIDNTASQKLLMSAGYSKEGILRQRVTRSDGSQIDMVELAVLASDWKELD
jgi:RimJ/RimL family protein N-acetyltransferase